MNPAHRSASAIAQRTAIAPRAVSTPQPMVAAQWGPGEHAWIAVVRPASAGTVVWKARSAAGAEIANLAQSAIRVANRTPAMSTSDRILELTQV